MPVLCGCRPLVKTERGVILEITFAGHLGEGSRDNLDANEMKAYVTAVVENDRPIAIVFNLTDLRYDFGDAIGGIAVPLILKRKSAIPACFVANGETARALQWFFGKNMIFGVAGFKLFSDHEQGLAFLRERITTT